MILSTPSFPGPQPDLKMSQNACLWSLLSLLLFAAGRRDLGVGGGRLLLCPVGQAVSAQCLECDIIPPPPNRTTAPSIRATPVPTLIALTHQPLASFLCPFFGVMSLEGSSWMPHRA